MKFLILNGPNLNLMRWSEPGVPGELDYNGTLDEALRAAMEALDEIFDS